MSTAKTHSEVPARLVHDGRSVYLPYDYEAQDVPLAKVYLGEADDAVRRQFAGKVLGQTTLMLLEVCAICAAGMASSAHTQHYLQHEGGWIFYVAIITSFAITVSFFCSPALLYHVPIKYVTLVVFGAAMGVMCMYATLQYTVASVLLAAGLTAANTLALTLYARTSKRDFTAAGGALLCSLWMLLLFGLLQIWFHDHVLQLLVATSGALLFSCFIVYDMQLILGGKHRRHQYGLDDDVLASISLFLDIINLFLYLLELVGATRN